MRLLLFAANSPCYTRNGDLHSRRRAGTNLVPRNTTVSIEAANGADAIEKAKKLKPDLIILDLAMPRMNGAAAASILKSTMPDVPIILFSMYDDFMSKLLSSAVPVDLVLSKPDGMNDMVAHVEDLLGSK
jgi:DNA-binding NarL/FixJ family response regulator